MISSLIEPFKNEIELLKLKKEEDAIFHSQAICRKDLSIISSFVRERLT